MNTTKQRSPDELIGDRNADYVALVDEIYAGSGDLRALLPVLHRSLFVLPFQPPGSLISATDGMTWIIGFTCEARFRHYLEIRGAAEHPTPWVTMAGSRLMGEVMDGVAAPSGVAIDLGSDRPILCPEPLLITAWTHRSLADGAETS